MPRFQSENIPHKVTDLPGVSAVLPTFEDVHHFMDALEHQRMVDEIKGSLNIDIYIAEARERLKRQNAHKVFDAQIKFGTPQQTAETLIGIVEKSKDADIPYADYITVLFGMKSLEKNVSYDTAREIYDAALRISNFLHKLIQQTLQYEKEIGGDDSCEEGERLRKSSTQLTQHLQSVWKHDVFASALNVVGGQELSNIEITQERATRGLLQENSEEYWLALLGLSYEDHVSQHTLRSAFSRISRSLHNVVHADNVSDYEYRSVPQALRKARHAFIKLSEHYAPNTISTTDEWLLEKQNVFTPVNWYLTEDLEVFAEKLRAPSDAETLLTLRYRGRPILLDKLCDDLIQLHQQWSTSPQPAEQILDELHRLQVYVVSKKDTLEEKSIPLRNIPVLWNRVEDIVRKGLEFEYIPHSLSEDQKKLQRIARIRRMIQRLEHIDHIDPVSTMEEVGTLLDVYVIRDLLESMFVRPPQTQDDWRIHILNLLPHSNITEELFYQMQNVFPQLNEMERLRPTRKKNINKLEDKSQTSSPLLRLVGLLQKIGFRI